MPDPLAGTRVAVTGASGRLGRALLASLNDAAAVPIAWSRPRYDLDDGGAAASLIGSDRPDLVIHAAAWTDVDGCAREPDVAMRRNGTAVGAMASAAASAGAGLVLISTNEVFDGERADGAGYREDDPTAPRNPYGAAKLEAERLAQAAFRDRPEALWIVRTAWLFGPPGADFPAKILAASARTPIGEPLRVVADEVGSPTYTPDLADAVTSLVRRAPGGVYHLAGSEAASRYDWAEGVLARCGAARPMERISRNEFQRASDPPPWGVLDGGRAASHGVRLRSWRSALDDYAAVLCPAVTPADRARATAGTGAAVGS